MSETNPGSLNSFMERTGLPEPEALPLWEIELNEFRLFMVKRKEVGDVE